MSKVGISLHILMEYSCGINTLHYSNFIFYNEKRQVSLASHLMAELLYLTIAKLDCFSSDANE